MSKNKVIVTAAITGAISVPSMTPYLPITPEQIIEEAVGAAEAGAAAVHIHVRVPEDGQPTNDINLIEQVYHAIRARSNVIIGVTTGGKLGSSLVERLAPVPLLKPELASCNAGTMNFCLFPLAERIKEPKFEWELPFIKSTYDLYTTNTFATMEKYITTMAQHNTKPEFEVFDVGMLNNIKYFIDRGILKTPIYLQFVMGVLGGIPATPECLYMLLTAARNIIGEENFVWSVAGAGKQQFNLGVMAMLMGGHIRVGLEDNLYISKGVLAKSNAEQVEKIRGIVEALDRKLATPDEAREILNIHT